jgi:hypothetical protein
MKAFLIIVGSLVGLLLLYLLLRPAPTVYPVASSYSGGTWGNLGRLLGSAIGTAAGSYAAAPKTGPATSPGSRRPISRCGRTTRSSPAAPRSRSSTAAS